MKLACCPSQGCGKREGKDVCLLTLNTFEGSEILAWGTLSMGELYGSSKTPFLTGKARISLFV